MIDNSYLIATLATMEPITLILALACGALVGFSLGFIGGGGSILATPLLLYVVGVHDIHLAIGTSALAVAANAATNLFGHARKGRVWWKPSLVFAGFGVLGALTGSTIGKHFPGDELLLLFALLMIGIALYMLRGAKREVHPKATISYALTGGIGFAVGCVSGFFGIGGGFLIVPGLLLATGMPILNAIASSLVAVTSFGLATAFNYALSGLVLWQVAGLFILGGFAGGALGRMLAVKLSLKRGLLNRVFAVIILSVAVYMLFQPIFSG